MKIEYLNTILNHKISGKVVDKQGNVNVSCKVSFCNEDGNVIRATTTNHKGLFEFVFNKDSLAPGNYIIKYYGNGVMTKSDWDYITIEPDSETNPAFDLTPPDNTRCKKLSQI